MKKTYIIAAILFCLSSMVSSAQRIYQKTYGDLEYKVLTDVCATSNNELVVAGYWTPSVATTPSQLFLTRLDTDGNVIWSKEYANAGISFAASISPASDGGFLVAGKIDTILGAGGSDNGFVMKVDGSGNLQWLSIVGGLEDEAFTRVYEAPNGEVIAIGSSTAQITGDERFWFVKMSSSGSVIHSFVYFPTANAEARTLAFHPDGGYIIGGIGRVNFIDEAYLFKISASGVLEWFKSYGTFSGSEIIHDMILLNDNSVVFVGTRYQANRDIFLGKTDSIGQLLWMNDFGGPEHDVAYRILEYGGGGYIVGGWTEGLDGSKGPLLFKTDANGNMDWAQVLGDGMSNGPIGLTRLPNGFYAMAGTILPDQGTAIGQIDQVDANGFGCNYSSVTLPLITALTVVDTPVVHATLGPGSAALFSPVISNIVLPDSTDCSMQSIEEQPEENLFEIYPNPLGVGDNGKMLWVTISNLDNEDSEVKFFDPMGRLIYRKVTSENLLSLSTAKWPAGIYLVTLQKGEQRASRCLIIQ